MSPENPPRLEGHIPTLISGCYKICLFDRIYSIRPPSVDLQQEAELYVDTLERMHKYDGLLREEVFINLCISREIIHPDYKNVLKSLRERADTCKMNMYKAYPQVSQVKQLRAELESINKNYNSTKDHIYNQRKNSLEGFLESSKNTYLFLNSIWLGEQQMDATGLSSQLVNHLMYQMYQTQPTEGTIRKIVQTEAWRSIWSAKKHDIFLNHISTFTNEQKIAIYFSELYDYARQHEDQLKDEILKDDDLFDGWYLIKVEEQNKGKPKKEISRYNDKHQEVFRMAYTQEDANAIYGDNDPEVKKILKDRFNTLEKKGSARDSDFRDVRQELDMAANRMMSQTIKKSAGKK